MHTNPLEIDDCFAVRQAARHISQLYERHLSGADVTPTQFNILRALKDGVSLTMVELANAMLLDRTTLVRALQPLLHSRLVANETSMRGVRRLHLVLTHDGRTKLDEATVHWRAAQDEFERQFGPSQAEFLRRELFRVSRDVSKT